MATEEAGLELPIGLTEQKFVQQLARIEARAIKAAQRGEQAFVKSNAQITRSFGQMSGAARGQLQNVSFQLQDIFVQISSGTSATRALGQQLPQLLSGFGAFGAVLGLVASAAIPLAANFLNAGEEAKGLADSIDNLESAVSAYREAVDAANAPTAELVEKYGVATQAAAGLLEQLSRLQQIRAENALSESVTAIAGSMEELRAAVQTVDETLSHPAFSENDRATAFVALNDQMVEAFGIAVPQARELIALLSDAQAARTVEDQAAAMDRLSSYMNDVVSSSDQARASFAETNEQAAQGALSAYELAAATGDAEAAANGVASAASGIAPVIDDASAAAANLTANLGAAMAQLNAVVAGVQAAQRQALATARIKLETVGDPEGRAAGLARQDYLEKSGTAAYAAIRSGSTAGLETISGQAIAIAEGARQVAAAEEAVSAAEAAYQKTVSASSAGGGGRKPGGGGKRSGGGGRSAREEKPFFEDIEKDLTNLNRQIELIGKSNEQVAEAKARWELLDEAKRRGLAVNPELNAQIDAQAAAVGRLAGELERAEISQDQFDQAIDGIADAMANALVAGESLRDGLAQVFKQIAADLLRSGIRGLISNLFGDGGGGDGGAGGIFGGFRAGGGSVAAGRAYVVGENGPELMVPGASGTILNASQISQAIRRGPQQGNSMSFSPSINVAGSADERTVALIEQAMGRERAKFFGNWMAAQKQFGMRMT